MGSKGYEHRPDMVGPENYPARTRLPALEALEGMTVRDVDGDKVGEVDSAYQDEQGGYVRYIAVKTGLVGRKRHVIPVDDVSVEGESLVVPYTRQQLEDAPTYSADDDLSPEDEREVYRHYGREGYWESGRAPRSGSGADEVRADVGARQTTPAPTPEVAEAEAATTATGREELAREREEERAREPVEGDARERRARDRDNDLLRDEPRDRDRERVRTNDSSGSRVRRSRG